MIIARPIPGWTPSTPPIVGKSCLASLDDQATIAVHFWAPWNGVDPPFDELLRQLAGRFASRVPFYSANIDLEQNRSLCELCQVLNVPVLSIRVNGVWQQPIVGCRATAEELAAEIDSRLGGQLPLGPPQDADRLWRRGIAVTLLGAAILIAAVAVLQTLTR